MSPETVVTRSTKMAHGALVAAVVAAHDKVGHSGLHMGAAVGLEASTGVEAEGTKVAHIHGVHVECCWLNVK